MQHEGMGSMLAPGTAPQEYPAAVAAAGCVGVGSGSNSKDTYVHMLQRSWAGVSM